MGFDRSLDAMTWCDEGRAQRDGTGTPRDRRPRGDDV